MGLFDKFKKITNNDVATNICATVKEQPINDDIPSLQDRIKNAFASKNGLYPHEILMLEYASSYKNRDNSFQSFWKWNYSVLDPQQLLESLYERGFICYGDVISVLNKTKVAELKEMLSSKGEKATGKKEALINKIIEVYDGDELEKMFPDRFYALTELGETEVRENEYVLYAHKKNYLSAWEMNVLMHNRTNPKFSYRDIIWSEFNKRSLEHIKDMNFGLYRNTRIQMSEFLVEEKRYVDALKLLIEGTSYDLSGLGNSESYILDSNIPKEERIRFKLVNLFVDEKGKEVIIPLGLIGRFVKLKEDIDLPDGEFVKLVYELHNNVKINNRIFKSDECANILLALMGLEDRQITGSYNEAVKRVKKMIV